MVYRTTVDSACAKCGKVRSYRPSEVKTYCSHACYAAARKGQSSIPKVTRPCERCGSLMTNWESQLGRFCSRDCANADKIQPLAERLWSKIDQSSINGCWLWTSGIGTDGYGKFWRDGRTVHAQRAVYELVHGPVAASLVIRHRCDTPLCCRPDHLLTGTPAENSQDMAERHRSAVGERHGSRTHPESVARGERHWSITSPETIKRGSQHGMAKLTEADVLEIRRLRTEQGFTYKVIGEQFGVTQTLACAIVKRHVWKHI